MTRSTVSVELYLTDKPNKKYESVGLEFLPSIGATISFNLNTDTGEGSVLGMYLKPVQKRYKHLNANRFKVVDLDVVYGDGETAFGTHREHNVKMLVEDLGAKNE